MTERSTIRLHPPVILWWVWVGFVALNVVDYGVQGLPSARFGTVLASILLLVTGLAYTLALRPKLVEDGDGLTVVNPFRDTRLPWPAIQSVDTGDWVRVHYTRPASTLAAGASGAVGTDVAAITGGTGGADGATRSTAIVHCWALYVSTSARRKLARGGVPTPDRMTRRLGVLAAPPPGYGQPSSRLPDEARRLAALPVSAAIAARLDSRAEKERLRAEARASTEARVPPGANATAGVTASVGASGSVGLNATDEATAVITTWSWPALAAVVIPAMLLLVVALL